MKDTPHVTIVRRFTDLKTIRLPSGKRRLLQDLTFYVEDPEFGISDILTSYKGSVTDYSTIPWYVSWVMSWYKVDLSGVIHDMLYTIDGSDRYPHLSRRQKDRIWRLIAQAGDRGSLAKINSIQGAAGYRALRMFGWLHYKKK